MANFLKRTFLFSLILSASAAWSQQQVISGSIQWQQAETFSKDAQRLTFEDANYHQRGIHYPLECQDISLPSTAHQVYEVEVTSYESRKLTAAERQLLTGMEFSTKPSAEASVGVGDGQASASICLDPFFFDGQDYRKITTYNISYRLDRLENKAASSFKKSTVNSALASDGWHKIAVSESGVFKITPQFLSDHDIGSGIPAISSLRVLGTGENMLPMANDADRPEGLIELQLKVVDGNNNGSFDGNDYALFYARGPHQWQYNPTLGRYEHILNAYRNFNYYFISVDNGPGKRVNTAAALSNPDLVVTSFDDYAYVEDEDENLVGTGKEWFGDVFDFTLSYNYDFSFPDLVTTEDVKIEVSAVGRVSTSNTELLVFNQGQQLMNIPFNRYSTSQGAAFGDITRRSTTADINQSNFTLRLQYDNTSNPAGVAWMDFIRVQARRQLIYRGGALRFRDIESVAAGQKVEYRIANANPNLEVWDVTEIGNAVRMPLTVNGQTASFVAEASELREYVALTGSGFSSPTYVKEVAPQNLRGLPAAEMLIVTHSKFKSAADRLAQFHRDFDGLSVNVATVEEVFNEFSSGGQDVTAIRDYARFNYEQAGSNFKHLLLFGDASYDYKDRLSNNTNYVPVLQSGSSLSLYYSEITDDYFAYLDPQEGNLSSNGLMDIGVGRIVSTTLAEANAAVDKAINYATNANSFGEWRNRILMMADDVDDANWEQKFVRESERFVEIINDSKNFNVEKIYLDAYQQQSTTGSETYPEASEDMFRQVQQGNLVTNYIGHGGEIGLASEKLLDLSDVTSWTNGEAMPLFCTITCEFTRFDDPKRTSAGELLALNPRGGAVALLTTTRVVFVEQAVDLNEAVFSTIFVRPGNRPKTFGEIIKDAKNQPSVRGDAQNRKFSLIGDPAIRLAIPYYNMNITEVNGKALDQFEPDTLGTLSKVSMRGEVNDFNDNKLTSFSGVADVSVFDKSTERRTLRNDNQGSALRFTQQNNLIYRGKVEVVNGDFNFEFIVPKDVSKAYGLGKVSLYANSDDIDAAGYMDTIVVGGFSDDVIEDSEGPVVELYMNDESFVRGGITGSSPELYAVISDSSGINTVGTGIGHDLVATLDNKNDQSYVLNQFYEADLNSYQSGKLRYPFYELEEGEHSLELEVFDVHNNVTKSTTEFVVADDEELALKRVLNYPNPFTTYTEFHFEHNRVGVPLDVQVQIFTVSGKLVKTINRSLLPTGNRVTGISWDGLDDYGDRIGKGVYVYRVKLRTELDDEVAEEYQKLVILR